MLIDRNKSICTLQNDKIIIILYMHDIRTSQFSFLNFYFVSVTGANVYSVSLNENVVLATTTTTTTDLVGRLLARLNTVTDTSIDFSSFSSFSSSFQIIIVLSSECLCILILILIACYSCSHVHQ